MSNEFAKDIIDGLCKSPKSLPSKYFYDKKGSELFSEIMKLPEYYLTQAELEIFTQQADQIIDSLEIKINEQFELIELGAGDGKKTIEFLKALIAQEYNFTYSPIDISLKALEQIKANILDNLPKIKLETKLGDYFKILKDLNNKTPKVVLFLGSNLGNMEDGQASKFLFQLGQNLNTGDKLLLGLDLQKSANIILPAYDDKKGITRDFNLNLLSRINNELEADFNLSNFEHVPVYDEHLGLAISYIESKIDQHVQIKSANATIQFFEGEKIQTEISRKYNDYIVNQLCEFSDFKLLQKFTDSKTYFASYVLEKKTA